MTYTIDDVVPLLQSICDKIDTLTAVTAGIIFFVGVIFGLLFVKILWDRFRSV